ncbi:MAG: UDP-2,3-diacylglucosamine diphosphatase [Mangrovibacterium sp.]
MIKDKIYFVSDVHLGAQALDDNQERELRFVRWLDTISIDAKQLFIMGDLFDYWFEYKSVIPRGYVRTLGKLAELSDKGLDIHFFIGNHDIWADNFFENEVGITIHKKEEVWNIFGYKVFLAHGDGLDPFDKGYLFLKKIFTNHFLQWCYAKLHPNFANRMAHRWSTKRRKRHQREVVEFKGKEHEGLYLYAQSVQQKMHIDYFIFGHRHLLLDLPIGNNTRYINLGDWINYFSYGVFTESGFQLKQLPPTKKINTNENIH